MSKKNILDTNFEVIKAHVLSPDPEISPLPPEKQQMMNRWMAAGKLIDQYPNTKHCVKLLCAKYPKLSERQAYIDVRMAKKLFNSMHTFDYDFWHSWLINDIVRLIKRSKDNDDLKAWANAQANLLKAIGERPIDIIDPEILQQHNYFTVINIDGKPLKLTLEQLHELPMSTRTQLVRQLEQPIDIDTAERLMKS